MMPVIREVLLDLIGWLICNVPGGIGRTLRRLHYKRRLGSMGKGVIIDCGVRILNPQWVHIGDNTWIDSNVLILASPAKNSDVKIYRKFESADVKEGEVRIEENCHIAPFVVLQGHGGLLVGANTTVASGAKVYSLSHHYRNPLEPTDLTPYKFTSMAQEKLQFLISAPVIIGPNGAVGLNAVLLPGSIVGEGAWVGAGSVIAEIVQKNVVISSPPRAFCRAIVRESEGLVGESNQGTKQP